MAWKAGTAPAAAKVVKNKVVYLDGLAALKIIKSCKEGLPALASGCLLGLDDETSDSVVLEVTNAFPIPLRNEGNMDIEMDNSDYQSEMMVKLREVNVDNNCVGWYQASYLGSFCNDLFIEMQFNYQSNLGANATVIIFDPLQSVKGSLGLKAYRLRETFMECYRDKAFTQTEFTQLNIDPNTVLEEIPIKLRNTQIVSSLLWDMEPTSGLDHLDLSANPYLERNLEFLCVFVDEFYNEQQRMQYHERQVYRQKQQQQQWISRQQESGVDTPEPDSSNALFRPIPEPSRLDALLAANQINTYCQQINRFAGQSFTKLFLAGSLHKN